MSSLRPGGSTWRWRKLRQYVLDTQAPRCRMLDAWTGRPCGRPATHGGHIRARRDGGTDDLSNLEPACAEHNTREGGLSRAKGTPAPATLTPAQQAIVAALDAAYVAPDAGRRTALRALTSTLAIPKARLRSADVDAACRWRRERAARLLPGRARW